MDSGTAMPMERCPNSHSGDSAPAEVALKRLAIEKIPSHFSCFHTGSGERGGVGLRSPRSTDYKRDLLTAGNDEAKERLVADAVAAVHRASRSIRPHSGLPQKLSATALPWACSYCLATVSVRPPGPRPRNEEELAERR